MTALAWQRHGSILATGDAAGMLASGGTPSGTSNSQWWSTSGRITALDWHLTAPQLLMGDATGRSAMIDAPPRLA